MSGGTNQKIKDQNKAVRNQFKYDRRMYDYTKKTNEARYEKAKADRNLQQANLRASARIKDQIAKQDFEYQSRLQNRQYKLDNQAYEQSLKDYDKQVELNSMSGAIALESAQRVKNEALIKKRFDLKDQDLAFRDQQSQLESELGLLDSNRKAADEARDIATRSITSKTTYAENVANKDKEENENQKTFLTDSGKQQQNKFRYADEKLEKDIGFIDSKAGWDTTAAQNAYDKQQVPNFNKRISAIIEREKAVGTARASGREGLSAERETSSALAEYGRSQAQLVDELVFAKADKDLADKKISGTKTYQKEIKGKDREINSASKEIDRLTTERQKDKLDISDSKIDLALAQTKAQLGFDQEKVTSAFNKSERDYAISSKRLDDKNKLSIKRNELAKDKIRTSFDSAKLQFQADKNKIKLDEYAANLRAQGQIQQRPKKPVPLPVPFKTPVSRLPMPDAPMRAPKPIRGALGKTSIWNDVGDVANVGLQVAGLFL